MKKRVLSLVTALALCLSMLPAGALALEPEEGTGLCSHHTEHTAECGYAVPTEGQPCAHQHDETCGYMEAIPETPCDKGCVDEDGDGEIDHAADCAYAPAVEGQPCQHEHDGACGYKAAEPGQPCGYECRICPVQELIDALPDAGDITAENAEDVAEQLDAISALWAELTDEETEQVDSSRYAEAIAAMDTLAGTPEASVPVPVADEIPMADTYGWNENHTVYTVIEQNGYPNGYYSEPISLADGAILDLRRADDFTNTTSKIYLFVAEGNLTILGDGDPINLNKYGIVRMPQGDHTLTLKNFCWDDPDSYAGNGPTGRNYWLVQENSTVTVKYEGKTTLPLINVSVEGCKVIFQPADADATLHIEGINYENNVSGSVEFNGGNVTVGHYIDAAHITIENHCKLSSVGADFSGLHFVTNNGSITITDSEVNLDCDTAYNTNQSYPALGGQGFNYTTLAGDSHAIQSKIEINNSKVTVNTDDAQYGTTRASYGGIGWAKDITIKDSDVTVSAMNQISGGGIGEYFQNIAITNSTVVSQAYCYAGIGSKFSSSEWSAEQLAAIKGSITITDSTVGASSVQGAGIGGAYDSSSSSPQPIDVIISGDSTVTARSVNGAGIGGGRNSPTISNPDIVVIAPDIGGGWGDGGSGGSLETFSLLSLFANVPPIEDSEIPTAVQKYVSSEGQTLTVTSTDKGTPTILAESGVCAISSETVDTDVTIVQNTVETAPSQTVPILVGDVKLGDLREDFKSIARTAPAGSDGVTSWDEIDPGTYSMFYGNGSDPDPLINNNDRDTKYQAGPYEIKENQINRFWTIPQQKLGGSAAVATGSASGTTVWTSTTGTTLYAKITSLTPSDVRSTTVAKRETLNYQWYKDGQPIADATSNSYRPTAEGLYWYVVTGSDRYRGSVTSTVVTVTAADSSIVRPAAPTRQDYDRTSITLNPVEGYEYGILQNDGTIQWQDDNVFAGLTPNTSYNFFQRVKANDSTETGPSSPSATFATKGDKPSELDISYDYENEWIIFNSDITVSRSAYSFSGSNKINTGGVITDYIGKTLYACYTNVSGTGDDVVLSFTVPARPDAPVLYPEDIQATTNSITITGTPGVAYNYAETGEAPTTSTAVLCKDGTVTFTGLTPDTEYTIYARWPASNEEQRFHSDEATISGKTLATEPASTKIYVPAGETDTRTYDLTEVLGDKTIGSIDDSLSASANGTSVTITPTGSETGTVTLSATLSDGSSYTIEVVFRTDVVGEGNNILWLWRSANEDLNNVAQTLLQSGESLGIGTTRRLTAIYASGPSAGKTVSDPGTAAVLLPYWDKTGIGDDWLLVYQSNTEAESITPLTLTADGIRLTNANPGIYGLYTVKPATQKDFKFTITEKTVTYGDEDFTVTAAGAVDGSTVTYSSSDTNVATVNAETGEVTIIGAGEATITATASEVAPDWKGTEVQYALTVSPKALTIAADNKTAYVGSPPPKLTYTVSGLVNGDTLTTPPTLACNADMTKAGTCEITVSGTEAGENYTIIHKNGTLTVTDKLIPVVKITADHAALTGGGTVTLTVAGLPTEGEATVTCSEESIVLTPGADNTWTAELPNAAAQYIFTVNYAGSTQYAAVTDSCTVSVTRKTSGGGGGGSSTYTVTVEDASHGTVKTDRARASSGTTVTITVTPDEGYKLDELTVTDSRGNELALTDKGSGKFTFKMPSGKVTVEAVFTAIETRHDCPSLDFTDLDVTAWYHEAVDYALENGMMSGYGSGVFGPNNSLSRAMLCQILYNLEDRPATGQSVFDDVANTTWYADAVTWANANGIVSGYGDGRFGPNDAITREQLATILWRYAQFKGYDTTQGGMAIREFSDYESISDYAVDAMTWAVNASVVGGYEDKTLRPRNGATRAQVAQMLMNFLKSMS